MSDHRHADALTDDAFDRDIAQALAVDPSPEFVARVRTRIANEPAPSAWRLSWTMGFAGASVTALVLAVVLLNRPEEPIAGAPLAARAIPSDAATLPDVGSAFPPPLRSFSSGLRRGQAEAQGAKAGRRTYNTQAAHSPLRAGPAEAGPHVLPRAVFAAVADSMPLLDPRETRALRSLIAGVRDSRVDLSPLLRPGAPAPMELPPVDDLVIAALAIEPLAPVDGAQGVRQ
jgi:hypothetical protein